jgi:hypothetical protein
MKSPALMPMPPPMASVEAREQILKARVEAFELRLKTTWEPAMIDEIALAANESEGVTGEDLRRLRMFIHNLTNRLFCLGVSAAIKAYPEFVGGVMSPPTRQELRMVPCA